MSPKKPKPEHSLKELMDCIFYKLGQVYFDLADRKYSALLLIAGNPENILKGSGRILDRRQHLQRRGLKLNPDVEYPEISVFDPGIEEHIINSLLYTPDKEEVDGTWVVDAREDTRGIVVPGTFVVQPYIQELEQFRSQLGGGRLEGGTGRRAVRANSLVLEETSGYFIRKSESNAEVPVREYRNGLVYRELTRTGIIRTYNEKRNVVEDLDINTGIRRVYYEDGNIKKEEQKTKMPIKPKMKVEPKT